jgi:hypothetical protein
MRRDVATPYAASRIKWRASAAEMEERLNALEAIVAEINPCSVRQVFYQAVVRGLLEKTENNYDKVQRALVKMRRLNRIPYGWIVDGTRWMHKPTTYSSLEQALQRTKQTYRRAIWDSQPVRVEIWLEKEALAGVIYDVTAEYDVPLYVARGFSSLTYLAEAASDIRAAGKPIFIYHLGDHDPSGRAAGEHIERMLRELAPEAEIHFERLAVTVEQIASLNLPTRPTKKTDSRAARFEAEFGQGSVELDAVHPDTLRSILREAIERHIDGDQLEVLKTAERSERKIIEMFAARSERRR